MAWMMDLFSEPSTAETSPQLMTNAPRKATSTPAQEKRLKRLPQQLEITAVHTGESVPMTAQTPARA